VKILKIQICNLASLAGIQAPIVFGPAGCSNGLVAITGVTGSGKSTILDALCLALFGTTPRMSQAPKGDSEGKDPLSILTRDSQESFVEVDFIDQYQRTLRAKWSIYRAKTGVYQTPKHTLHLLNNDHSTALTLGDKATTTKIAVQEALGMGYDQFVGVVVLSQGSFSSFLKGDKTTRSQLLERLTNTAIYQKISKASHKDHSNKDQIVKSLEQRLHLQQPLTVDERHSLRLQIDHTQQQALQATQNWQHWDECFRNIESVLQAKQKIQQVQTQLATVELENNEFSLQRQQHALAEQAEVLRLPHEAWRQAQQATVSTTQQAKRQKDIIQDQQQKLYEELQQCQLRLLHFQALQELHTQWVEKLSPAQVSTPDLIAQGKSIVHNLAQTHKQVQQSQTLYTKQGQSIEILKASLIPLRQSQHEALLQWQTSQQQLTLLKNQQEEWLTQNGDPIQLLQHRQLLEQILNYYSQLIQLRQQTTILCNNLNGAQDKHKAILDHLQQQSQLFEQQQQQLALALESHDCAQTNAKIASGFRHHLQLQQPCPLCETIVEKLPHSDPHNTLVQSEKLVKQCRETLNSSRLKKEQLQQECNDHGTKLQTLTYELEQKHLKIFNHQQQCDSAWTKSEAFAQKYSTTLENASISPSPELAQQWLKKCAQLLEQWSALQRPESDLQKRTHQRQQFYLDIDRQLQHKSQDLAREEGAQQETSHTLSQLKQQLLTLAQLKQTFMDDLTQQCGCSALPNTSTESQDLAWLEARSKEYHLWTTEQQDGKALRTECETDLDAIVAYLQKASLPIEVSVTEPLQYTTTPQAQECRQGWLVLKQQYKKSLEQQEQLHRANVLLQQLEQQQWTAIDKQNVNFTAWQNARNASNFESDELALANLLPYESLQLLRRQVQTMDARLLEARTKVAEAQRHLSSCTQKLAVDAPEDLDTWLISVNHLRQEAKVSIEQWQTQLGACQQKMQADEECRLRNEQLIKELQLANKDLEKAHNLKKLIGHNNGDLFRDYAQSITLTVLIQYANFRLAGFAPRYQLATRENLQMDIIDHDQAGLRRPANTLSGGESFLVSLALAIALADFNRGSASIGSVFIDEGFGSLDNASLNIALAALEDVQHQLGAQIIVISHVGELENRWADHICVQRYSGGRSWIQVPGGPKEPRLQPQDLPQQTTNPLFAETAFELLSQHSKMTTKALAKHLHSDDIDLVQRSLLHDERFTKDGKNWSLR
jgi:DNA repair protein SbcC/Rad50